VRLDLNKLFVEPRHIRSGVGRVLLRARRRRGASARRRAADDPGLTRTRRASTKRNGSTRGGGAAVSTPTSSQLLGRVSPPRVNGAVRIGEAPSDAVPGRLLRTFGFTSQRNHGQRGIP
jgi:hypothetical protein